MMFCTWPTKSKLQKPRLHAKISAPLARTKFLMLDSNLRLFKWTIAVPAEVAVVKDVVVVERVAVDVAEVAVEMAEAVVALLPVPPKDPPQCSTLWIFLLCKQFPFVIVDKFDVLQ